MPDIQYHPQLLDPSKPRKLRKMPKKTPPTQKLQKLQKPTASFSGSPAPLCFLRFMPLNQNHRPSLDPSEPCNPQNAQTGPPTQKLQKPQKPIPPPSGSPAPLRFPRFLPVSQYRPQFLNPSKPRKICQMPKNEPRRRNCKNCKNPSRPFRLTSASPFARIYAPDPISPPISPSLHLSLSPSLPHPTPKKSPPCQPPPRGTGSQLCPRHKLQCRCAGGGFPSP